MRLFCICIERSHLDTFIEPNNSFHERIRGLIEGKHNIVVL